ncbi:MAG: heterodisulfide reductase-related iron-sulfur binding cluster [Bacteriovoracaceae bacterium]|jgi:Fe-S oxidoreductase/nitrate reductase gamma subunit|nr:heterodisulfide reductase-related iron-sulfur binding cluster [Bacteriovoracaceae bacterium]
MDPTLATREIFWQIPFSFKVAMYIFMFIALGVFAYGVIQKLKYVTQGNGIKSLLPKQLNWKNFIQTIFFTGKVTRDKKVGFFHSLIYYGFAILLIATELVAIHADSPFKVYQGTTYIVISFLADIAGVAILIGLSLAYKRRYIDNPKYLSATRPNNEKFMYAMIFALVIIGFLLEAMRIVGAGMPGQEAIWSPVGFVLALGVNALGLSETLLVNIYKGTWLFHMLNTMVFIACISHTKFFHMVALPFNALVTPFRRGGVLEPMNFEDETAETFGLGKASELSAKQRMDTLSCVECGRCTQVCPANIAGRPLDPKLIITKTRDNIEEAKGEDVDFWEKQVFTSAELDSCTTCGACMEECPANIEHVQSIMGLKRYKALTLGDIPPEAATSANNIRVNGNPWGVSQDDRFQWADGLDVPVIEAGKKVDYLYYVGCAGSYDASNQKVVKDTVQLLKKAGVDFAVMGKTEKCNGDPIRRFGDEYTFFEVAIENIANMRQYDFGKVVTHCPHCLHTIGKEYAKFDDGDFETIHHTELLADLVKTGKLKPTKEVKEELTFHDPCYLGRHHGEYDAPREVLKSIPGVEIKEMVKNKDKALCCGMGGGNMWYEMHEGNDLVENRLEHVGETKVYKLATSCSFCMINFNSGKGKVKETEELEVEDIASILSKSVE